MNCLRFHFVKLLFIPFIFCFGWSSVQAHNLSINQVSRAFQDTVAGYSLIQFNMSWDNSWRLGTAPANWDAVWVFVKFRLPGGNWQHASLNYVDGTSANDGHGPAAGSVITTPTDGKGVFMYRDTIGMGNINWQGLLLRWNDAADGVAPGDSVEVRLFGIEMVYIPAGSFYAGDGENRLAHTYGHFEDGISGNSLQIVSESGLTLGGGSAGSLGNNNRVNHFGNPDCDFSGCLGGSGDDFSDAASQNLPAAFPKGYAAFYVMKYEMTQALFADLLNSCTPQQQALLTASGHFYPSLAAAQSLRYGISHNGTEYITSEPDVPMIYLDWVRGAACADWAALRPMTELEFEKACRGPLTPLMGEYPWGNPDLNVSQNFSLSNMGMPDEEIALGYDGGGLNGNAWIRDNINLNMTTVARVGIFAAHPSNSGRVSSGAAYYGIFDLGGNAWERTVSVGHSEGRKFTGSHGDGALDVDGYADMPDWPGSFSSGRVETNVGVGYRGGGLAWPTPNTERNARISSRRLASGYWNTVIEDDGLRMVRTAP